jgi:PadR family transcriptional regulator PadR
MSSSGAARVRLREPAQAGGDPRYRRDARGHERSKSAATAVRPRKDATRGSLVYLCRISLMRRTKPLLLVAVALMEDPDGQHWGYDLTKRAGLRSGVLYPLLHRMLDEGWLEDGWEDEASGARKRPPRRYYALTDEGRRALGGLAEQARHDARAVPGVGGLALNA